MLQLLHTPDGVRDYYGNECAARQAVCRQIKKTFSLYGFQEIQTPVFEYFDIFNAERGSVASRNMYKLFDRDGETLVLRPDFTPAIARCAAKYFGQQSMPVRLCYLGNTYVNTAGYRGQLRESTQAGVELVGDGSVAANAEILSLVISMLQAAGLTRFQIEVGDVRFFNSLMEEAGLPEEARRELRGYIENKNHFAIEELLSGYPLSEKLSRILSRLPQLFGDPAAILAEVRTMTESPASLHALDRLERLIRYMDHYGQAQFISFDLGMLGQQDYYTGMIFKAYTYGTGEHIVTGGRYDGLMKQFGKDAPSVGFGCNIDALMQAISRQNLPQETLPETDLVIFGRDRAAEAVAKARELRAKGRPVILMPEEGREADLTSSLKVGASCLQSSEDGKEEEESMKEYCLENHIGVIWHFLAESSEVYQEEVCHE